MATPQVTARILRRLLASGVNARAERLLARTPPADLAPVLSGLTKEETARVIDMLFRERRAARVLRELPPEMLPEVLDAVSDERLAGVLDRLEIDDLMEMIDCIPEERREGVLARLPERARAEIEKARLYAEASAGRVMLTRFVALDEKMTAQEAIDALRARGDDDESILYLYVVDDQKALRGVVPIRRLLSAPPARLVRDLMVPDPVSVHPEADQEEVAKVVARYDLLAVPVTDVDGRMLGVITVDDVIDVIHEEATEDMYHLAGLSDEDRVFSPALTSVRRRLPWMLTNLGTAFLVAWVVGLFERTLEQVIALAIFMPIVAMLGGNAGIQSLTVITRGIALGEIEFSSALRAALKEIMVGVTIGAVVGAVAGGVATFALGNPWLGVALAVSMVITMAGAGLMGAAVPLMLKALRMDPALGSGVIVTAFTDVFGLSTFLGVGTLLLDRLT